MLRNPSVINGYAIAASDGHLGGVSDFRFDGVSRLIRWLVVNTGTRLSGREVLLAASALGHLDPARREFSVRLTRQQVKDSKVNSLMLAGASIDADAGNGSIKRMVHESKTSFYEELVTFRGGLMRGNLMLQGWKNMHPEQHYIQDHIDLYEHIDDPAYLAKEEIFESWYKNLIDLPGRWYLQVITQLFKVPRDRIVQKTVPGSHIGLFMGATTLKEHWPPIAQWIAAQQI